MHTVSLHSGPYLKKKVVPEEISTNYSPQFISTRIQSLLKDQCVNHGLSSAYYTKSSGRAGFGVTTFKIIWENNISSEKSVNNDQEVGELLQFHNTQIPSIHLSPEQLLLYY